MPGSATIQNNRLQLEVIDAGAGFEQGVYALMQPSLDVRIDCDVVIPGPGQRFFHSFHVRNDGGDGDHYYVMLARSPAGAAPFLRINKSVAGVNSTLSDVDFPLSDAITHYQIRAQITSDGEIRGVAQDFALGPIPEDLWNIEADDEPELSIPGAGVARINLTNLAGDGTDDVTIDNVVISVLEVPTGDSIASAAESNPSQVDTATSSFVGPWFATAAESNPMQMDDAAATFGQPFFGTAAESNPAQTDAASAGIVNPVVLRPFNPGDPVPRPFNPPPLVDPNPGTLQEGA